MNYDPVTEPAQQTAHLLPLPLLGLPTTVRAFSSRCRETTGGSLSETGPQPGVGASLVATSGQERATGETLSCWAAVCGSAHRVRCKRRQAEGMTGRIEQHSPSLVRLLWQRGAERER